MIADGSRCGPVRDVQDYSCTYGGLKLVAKFMG